MTEIVIAPKTKVAELIDAYPQLEQVLIGYVPAFEKLRNPILRKTVARITTLQQAAVIGGVNVEDLINHLRKEVGQDHFSGAAAAAYTTEQPWRRGSSPSTRLSRTCRPWTREISIG
jgi:hypothetical protein